MHKAVGMKLKVQWRPQDIDYGRNVACHPRKASGYEWSHPERGFVAAAGKPIGLWPPIIFGTHILPPCAPVAGYGTTGFNVCPMGQSCFGLILCCPPVHFFWDGNIYPVALPLGLGLLKNARTLETMRKGLLCVQLCAELLHYIR